MKTLLASVAAVALWAAAPQPAAAMPLVAGVTQADAANGVTEVQYRRRHYRHRYVAPRYVAPYPYSYGYGGYGYGYPRYYAPGPSVYVGPRGFGFGFW